MIQMIRPTMKERKRYLLFEVAGGEFSGEQVKRASYDAILSFLGEYGSSLANPKFVSYDAKRKLAVLRCTHTEADKVRAALALATKVAGVPAALRVVKVSGTIAGLGR